MSFGKWNTSVHDNFEQLKRRISAAKIDEDDIELNPANQTAHIYGSDPEPYFVTLEECSCYDFQSRNLPCKHMYRLASELGCLDDLPSLNPNTEKEFEDSIMEKIDHYYRALQDGAISADRFVKITNALLTGCSKKFPGSKRKATQEFKEQIPAEIEQFEQDFKNGAISADKFIKIASALSDILK